jgi:exopolyphosphatase/guanosine-5'-triphosphate,3'-diphosphate pyrophosphatase
LGTRKADTQAPAATGNGNAKFASALIKLDDLERFNKRVSQMSLPERRQVDNISSQRAEIIIAGGAVLEGAMRSLNISELRSNDWALREGVVVDRLREMEAERLPPVPDSKDPRLRSVHAVGKRFRYEETHARHVAYLAERIYDQTGALHGLARHHRTLLAAAALLHDVGYAIAHDSHHKHTQYIIRHAELTGFSETERLIVALIARYHRRALPKERHPEFASLAQTSRDIVWRLGGILRIAEALDRNHDARVRDVRCEIRTRPAREIHLSLQCEENCVREARAVENSSEMFVQAFDCAVVCHYVDEVSSQTALNE